MEFLGTQINFVIQGLMLAIIIGIFYNLWNSTQAYGGLIGKAIRLLGIGIILITVGVIERVVANFNVVDNPITLSLIQDILNLVGLFFLAIGFSRLASASKA